jgi:hypothetical protein
VLVQHLLEIIPGLGDQVKGRGFVGSALRLISKKNRFSERAFNPTVKQYIRARLLHPKMMIEAEVRSPSKQPIVDAISSEPLGADRLRKESRRRAKASGIVVKEELDLKSLLLELWQQNQRTREPNLR